MLRMFGSLTLVVECFNLVRRLFGSREKTLLSLALMIAYSPSLSQQANWHKSRFPSLEELKVMLWQVLRSPMQVKFPLLDFLQTFCLMGS